jgi:hypothetical protein
MGSATGAGQVNRTKALEREVKELRQANETLKLSALSLAVALSQLPCTLALTASKASLELDAGLFHDFAPADHLLRHVLGHRFRCRR